MHLPADAKGHRPGGGGTLQAWACCSREAAGEAVPGDRAPVWGCFDAGEGPAGAARGFGAGIGVPGDARLAGGGGRYPKGSCKSAEPDLALDFAMTLWRGFRVENGGFSVLGRPEKAAAALTWCWQQPCMVGKRPPGPSANTSVTPSSLHHVFLGQREQIQSLYLSAGSTFQISSASLGCRAATNPLQCPNPNTKYIEKEHF